MVIVSLAALFLGPVGLPDPNILLNIRLPRVLLGLFVGSGLAASGATFQGVLRNPLADPFILGTSSAATVGVTSGESVHVSGMAAEIFIIPGGPSRPVNQVWLFLEKEGTGIILQAFSGRTGVPGTDSNPLIDKDLLIQVVAENLQPIP